MTYSDCCLSEHVNKVCTVCGNNCSTLSEDEKQDRRSDQLMRAAFDDLRPKRGDAGIVTALATIGEGQANLHPN